MLVKSLRNISHTNNKFKLPVFIQTSDLTLVFKDSSPTTPLIFVLSTGTDPANDLYKFAEEMRFSKKLTAISLGQGQVLCYLVWVSDFIVVIFNLLVQIIFLCFIISYSRKSVLIPFIMKISNDPSIFSVVHFGILEQSCEILTVNSLNISLRGIIYK